MDYPNNPGYFTSLYLGDATVSLSASDLTYDANAKAPNVTVAIGNNTLTYGSDYTVSYLDNVNADMATVNTGATSDGIYEGSTSTTF